MSHGRTEREILRELIQHPEGTMNLVTSASVGMALLKLRDNHLSEEMNLDEFFQDQIKELETLAKQPEHAAFKASIEYIIRKAKEPVDVLDVVSLAHKNDNGTIGETRYVFPLKEVLALVWVAINDNSYYMHAQEGTTDQKREQAQADFPERLRSFLLRTESLRLNPVCHHGHRHELVFLLNGTYEGIHILEDGKLTVLCFLKDKLNAAFWNAIAKAEEGSAERKALTGALLQWMNESNANPLLALLDSAGEIKSALEELFIAHGVLPAAIKLDEMFVDALSHLEFTCDQEKHPALYQAGEIAKEPEDLQYAKRSEALRRMQTWFVSGYQLSHEDNQKISHFHLAYFTHKKLQRYRDLFLLSGQRSQEECEGFLRRLDAYFDAVKEASDIPDVPADMLAEVMTFQAELRIAESDRFVLVIENFFAQWFLGYSSQDSLKKLYAIFCSESFKNKIILTDEEIASFVATAAHHGELDITPYMLNRIFLHAILVSPENWSNDFTILFNQAFSFVENAFNQPDSVRSTALMRDSYPLELREQLQYLKQKKEEVPEEQNRRPATMLLLPEHARTMSDWLKVFAFSSDESHSSLLQRFRVLIQRAIQCGNDIYMLSLYISDAGVSTFFALFSEKLKVMIQDGAQLIYFLKLLPETRRVELIAALGERLRAIIDDHEQLAVCVFYLPVDRLHAFINMMHSSHAINILHPCLWQSLSLQNLSVEKMLILVATLAEKWKGLGLNGYHLAAYLNEMPVAFRIVFVATLGAQVKDIIQDRDQLIACLAVLPEMNWRTLFVLLGEKVNEFIQTGSEIAAFLSRFDISCWPTLITLLAERMAEILRDDSQLVNCIGGLPEAMRLAFVDALRDKGKVINIPGMFFDRRSRTFVPRIIASEQFVRRWLGH
jgi:hypothetical protein